MAPAARVASGQRDDMIEIYINPDGQIWSEFQGDHFMRSLGTPLTQGRARIGAFAKVEVIGRVALQAPAAVRSAAATVSAQVAEWPSRAQRLFGCTQAPISRGGTCGGGFQRLRFLPGRTTAYLHAWETDQQVQAVA